MPSLYGRSGGGGHLRGRAPPGERGLREREPDVYSSTMDVTGPTLAQRAVAVLRAKQYLVFYAIPIHALATLTALALSWLHEGGAIDEVLGRARAPLYDAVAAPGVVAAALVVAYLVPFTWFRAGLIRSIVGRLHFRPQDGRQFWRLLALHLLIELVSAAGVWAVVARDEAAVAAGAGIAVFAFTFAVMYADYAIVVTGLGTLRALARSWACVRANLALSALLVLLVTLVSSAVSAVLDESLDGRLLQAAPLLVVAVVVMGLVTFVADVVLIVAYVHAVENGRLPHARRRT